MRRRLWKFLPIVMMALMVQILAPIGACWAASIAASDPLHAAPICSGGAASGAGYTDQSGGPHAHDGACSQCCVAQAAMSLDGPQNDAAATPWRHSVAVVWFDSAPDLFSSRTGAHARARAPPSIS